MANPIQITVGGSGEFDPAPDDTEVSIPTLEGYEYYLTLAGYGPIPYVNYELLPAGGFRLLNGYTFTDGEVYSLVITGITGLSNTAYGPYSNGYNLAEVLPKLFGRLNWLDSSLNSTNTTSISGRYFDDGSFHSLVTVPNIKATVPEQSNWNTFFQRKQNAVIARCLNSVFNEPEYIQQTLLYDRCNEQETLIPNEGKAVGVKIHLIKRFDVSCFVNSLQLYFDGAATFNIYLFKQGSKTALKTKSVTTVANTKTWIDLSDWLLNYKESAVYYVVYFQNDLGSVKAIQEQAEECKTLAFDADFFTATTTGTDFNRVEMSEYSLPHGLNMQVSSFRDYSQNILNQPALFDNLIGLTMAYQTIEDMIYSVQSSGKERIIKEQLLSIGIQLDLNGVAPISESPKVIGLKQRIDQEAARVKKAFYAKPKSQTVNLC